MVKTCIVVKMDVVFYEVLTSFYCASHLIGKKKGGVKYLVTTFILGLNLHG